jgi:predicted ATPase/DNA-binding winged helix-turn-helix (wHTH) protein
MSTETIQAQGETEVQFGPFRFFLRRRVLLRADTPVRLGSRAQEILLALVERPGELVSKSELTRRVWPNTVVEKGTLRVHINWLRKALGEVKPERRYLETVTGLGYRFVAPVIRLEAAHAASPATRALPATRVLPARMIGRDAILSALMSRLERAHSVRGRLVTIVGPGGSGKTTVAANLADLVQASYSDGVRFVDLAASANLSPAAAVAEAFGLESRSADSLSRLTGLLQDRQLLIVLDNCEHVIGVAAALAERLLDCSPDLHILATSREPLRTRSEWVLRLPALELPPADRPLTAQEALRFPAVQLFVERAASCADGFELTDANASIVADICRKLEGLPLAIESAAARVDIFGIHQVRSRIEDPLGFLTRGCRTAPARQRTLRATLDWSYATLSGIERIVFRRLAVFDRGFDLDSAVMEVADETIEAAHVPDLIASLAAKSVLTREESGGGILYGLSSAWRAYALEKLDACAGARRIEFTAMASRASAFQGGSGRSGTTGEMTGG